MTLRIIWSVMIILNLMMSKAVSLATKNRQQRVRSGPLNPAIA